MAFLGEGNWHPTLVFLPGKSHGQWSLEGYSPYGSQELDTTEQACMRLQDEESHRDRNRRKPCDDRGTDQSFASSKPRNTKDPEFPDGLVVRIWCFHCRGLGSLDPWLETVGHAVQCSQNIKTNTCPPPKKNPPRIYSNDQQLGRGKVRFPRAFR